jgi:hypothetical protein
LTSEKRPVVAFDQIGTPSIRMLKAGVDTVPSRDAARERDLQDLGRTFLLERADVWRVGVTSPPKSRVCVNPSERQASLGSTGLYFVGTCAFSSSNQLVTIWI